MPEHLMVIYTNAVEGREKEYSDWYTERHMPDLLKIPGIKSARRFKLAGDQLAPPREAYGFAALYQIDTDDLGTVLETIRSWAGTEKMPRSDAMGPGQQAMVFTPITDTLLPK